MKKKYMVLLLTICIIISVLLGIVGLGVKASAVTEDKSVAGISSDVAEKASSAADLAPQDVAAFWDFSKDNILKGSLDKNDLALKDKSGNGNDLYLKSRKATKELSFVDNVMYDGTSSSLQFNSAKRSWFGGGSDFRTEKNAPLNKETFENGYTIEFIYMLPSDFTVDDAWMGLMGRQGKSESNTETKSTSTSIAISNCKELQFYTANAKDNHTMSSAAWSIAMDKGGVWYHIAITSDGETIRTFVNGCESFRDYVVDLDDAAKVQEEKMKGLFADPDKGQFVIGSFGNGLFNHYLRGNIQQVRIARRALNANEWLVQHPEKYIGEYGSNKAFQYTGIANYNIVFMPDIQNATEYRPEVLNKGFDWLIENQDELSIRAMVGLGDNVNDSRKQEQWDNAVKALSKIQGQTFPFINQPGNHDYAYSSNAKELYLNNFGKSSAFGAQAQKDGIVFSPSGYSSYVHFYGGSYEYLVLALSMNHLEDPAEIGFAKDVLEQYKNVPTIVTSHDVQNADDAAPDKVHLSENGVKLWHLIKGYNQVFMLYGGHSHGAGEEVLKNDAGNEVYSILADYQFSYNGGNLWLKFAEFDENRNQIKIATFSPYAASLTEKGRTFFDVNYMTGKGNYTVIDFDFEKRFADMQKAQAYEEYEHILSIANQIYDLQKGVSAKQKVDIEEWLRISKEADVNTKASMSGYVPLLEEALKIATKLTQEKSEEVIVPKTKIETQLFEVEKVLNASMATEYKETTSWLIWVIIIFVLAVIICTVIFLARRKKKQKES